MTFSRKITAVAIAAGLATSGTGVAHAQSSSFFGGLSSSQEAPAPINYDEERTTLKELYLTHFEEEGHLISDKASEIAQQGAEMLAEGEAFSQQFCIDQGGACRAVIIPNILLDSEIDKFPHAGPGMNYVGPIVGVGVASNDFNTYIVLFEGQHDWTPQT